MKRLLLLLVFGMSWTEASAITIDGVVDAEYGSALAIQDTPTGFGNNESELNAAYAKLDASGNLSLMLTGNLQGGGNGIVIFIDSRAGGGVAETLAGGFGKLGSLGGARTDDWGTDTDGGSGVSATPGGASILDPGFNPDVSIEINAFGVMGYFTSVIDLTLPNDNTLLVPPVAGNIDVFIPAGNTDFSHPRDGTVAVGTYDRADNNVSKGEGGTITHAFINTNTAGVNGFPGALGDPLSATTGYEATFSSTFLANDGQSIRMMAFITNDNGGFLANQFLGEAGVGGVDNLGGPNAEPGGTPLFDAQVFTGNQFFTVPPAAAGQPGDYNNNGTVDAADYALWRDGGPLLNDATPGVQPGDYDVWQANFGKPPGAGSGSAVSTAVPEPGTFGLLLLAGVAACSLIRRR